MERSAPRVPYPCLQTVDCSRQEQMQSKSKDLTGMAQSFESIRSYEYPLDLASHRMAGVGVFSSIQARLDLEKESRDLKDWSSRGHRRWSGRLLTKTVRLSCRAKTKTKTITIEIGSCLIRNEETKLNPLVEYFNINISLPFRLASPLPNRSDNG